MEGKEHVPLKQSAEEKVQEKVREEVWADENG